MATAGISNQAAELMDPLEIRLARSRRLLDILFRELTQQQGSGERRLQLLESAGRVAWMAHSGTFVLPLAERILEQDPGLADFSHLPVDTTQVRGRTLHVLTEAYAVGGHTRLVKRWIELLGDEPQAIVIVRQGGGWDPARVKPRDSDAPLLNLQASGVTRRTAKVGQLIELFRAAARVVLHIHPDDACSVAAAYRVPEAEIHVLNHADHVAWLGAGLPASFLNLRPCSTKLAEARRGISATACDEIPIPITPPPSLDRGAARLQLGLGSNDVLILTVASGYKYNPIRGDSLFGPLDRLLVHPRNRLVAIGPDATHPLFRTLKQRYPERVTITGILSAPHAYRAAADVYLDSYPFASTTSMLESAALGTPVVAYQPNRAALEILYSECPWLDRDAYAASDSSQLVDLVETLASDSVSRNAIAQRQLAGIVGHLPAGWRAAVGAHFARSFRRSTWSPPQDAIQSTDLDVALAGLGTDARRLSWNLHRLGIPGLDSLTISNVNIQLEALMWCAWKYAGHKVADLANRWHSYSQK